MENLFLVNEGNYRSCYNKSAIHTLKLKQLSLMCDNLLWGYDYLTLISYTSDLLLTCPCFSKIMNDTNNAQIFIPGTELEKCPFDMVNITLTQEGKKKIFMVSVSYKEHPVNICRFTFYGTQQGKLMSQIDIYGKAWRLQSAMNNEFLLDMFIRSLVLWNIDIYDDISDDYIQAFFSYYVSRVDFRIDFWSKDKAFYDNIIHPYDLMKRKMKGKAEYYSKDGKTYTDKVVGSKSDNYLYIRFYDKKQEILDDNTEFLYSDYYNYQGKIWRLEFEFRSRFTTARKKYNFWDLFSNFDNGGLVSQIFEYLGLDVKKGCFSRFYKPQDIPFDKLPVRKKKSIATRLKNTLDYLETNGINSFAYIDLVYQDKNDIPGLEKIYKSLGEYIDNKDKIKDSIKKHLGNNDIIEI